MYMCVYDLSSHHFHVVVWLEVYTQGGEHDASRIGDKGGDFLSRYLHQCLLIQVLQPAHVERYLGMTLLNYAVNLYISYMHGVCVCVCVCVCVGSDGRNGAFDLYT